LSNVISTPGAVNLTERAGISRRSADRPPNLIPYQSLPPSGQGERMPLLSIRYNVIRAANLVVVLVVEPSLQLCTARWKSKRKVYRLLVGINRL